eukprot:1788253-Prymnesium_polylepis.1
MTGSWLRPSSACTTSTRCASTHVTRAPARTKRTAILLTCELEVRVFACGSMRAMRMRGHMRKFEGKRPRDERGRAARGWRARTQTTDPRRSSQERAL